MLIWIGAGPLPRETLECPGSGGSTVAKLSGRVDFLRWPSLARTLKRRAEARIFYLLGSAFAFLSL